MFKIIYGTLNGDGDICDLTCHSREAKKYEYEFEGETNIGYALPSHLEETDCTITDLNLEETEALAQRLTSRLSAVKRTDCKWEIE